MNYLGMRIFYNPRCLEKTSVPVRVYKRPRWQSARKAGLIQKKWVKRFGHVMKPCMYQTLEGFFVHPSFKAELERALKEKSDGRSD